LTFSYFCTWILWYFYKPKTNSNVKPCVKLINSFRRWVRYGLSSKYACYIKSRFLWWWPTSAFISDQNPLLWLRKWWLWEGQCNIFEENVDFFHRQHDKTHLSDSQGLSRGRMFDRQVKRITQQCYFVLLSFLPFLSVFC
jgi:hypothetical protein